MRRRRRAGEPHEPGPAIVLTVTLAPLWIDWAAQHRKATGGRRRPTPRVGFPAPPLFR